MVSILIRVAMLVGTFMLLCSWEHRRLRSVSEMLVHQRMKYEKHRITE